MARNGEGQSSHVLVFCVNFEWQEIIACTLNVRTVTILMYSVYNTHVATLNAFSKEYCKGEVLLTF